MKVPMLLVNGKIYGLSNGGIDQWDKVVRGTESISNIIKEAENELVQPSEIPKYLDEGLSKEILIAMKDDNKSSWALTQNGTGYPKYWEFTNSSVFIRNNLANFCTISTSLLIVHKTGECFFRE
jgi:hypothetical protein